MKLVKKTRIIIMVAAMILLLTSSVLAMDSRITASDVKLTTKKITAEEAKNNSNWRKGYLKAKASGYTTAKQRHYTNVVLYCLGFDVKKSGRKWGTGKVSASMSYWKGGCALLREAYGRAVYYGF